ncbi:MAG: carbamoyl-phosphate synthase small subunit [Actinobacteria bacterium]|nr:MAG: carbamoyl-phosphate synthase small subunit [Actinomycetota bacterium]
MSRRPGFVLLEDGARFDGDLCAADPPAVGEVVFNTAMSGYQEAVTDPSYAGQLITFTYPHVGNYGVSAQATESDRVHARAAIMRAAVNREDAPGAEGGWLDWLAGCGIPAITGVDTRALVRHIREQGAMRGGVFPAELSEEEARALVEAEPRMDGRDLAREVTPGEPIVLGPTGAAALDYVVDTVRELVGERPVFGICLGHQLLCRAVGLETFKLRFGHRGANHPVKDLQTGRIEITSQNHGFAVVGPDGETTIAGDEPVRWQTDFGTAELTHLNLYDRTVEGLTLRDVPGATVQYHPEAGPGPHDSLYLFDRFLDAIAAAA